MSGFAGIVNLDGAPIDPILLERMTRSLVFRGPDSQRTWRQGPVGLGHALLRTTWESAADRQPAILDERLAITADARIDARADLVEKLNANFNHGREISLTMPDSELILHAFDVWGRACVDHLLGDFSFAIWDAEKRQLFCACDHFGVKQLYYACIGHTLIFSNNLETLRLHPGLSSDLCDAAIADFLMFGMNWHPARTAFKQILRIPRAHILVASPEEFHVQRYWSFPIEEPLRYRRAQDYTDQFGELLRAAVSDRLRCDRVSIALSGGLDSPAVAAEAVEQLGSSENILGITAGFTRLIPDPEPPFARMVAEYLKIPWHFIAIDDYKPFQRWGSPGFSFARPADITMGAMNWDVIDRVAAHGRVLLTGEGGDTGLEPSLSYYRGLGAFRLIFEVGKYMLAHGHHPRIGIRVGWQRWRGVEYVERPVYPAWLNTELQTSLGLSDRWSEVMKASTSDHPFRPEAHAALNRSRVAYYTTDEWCRRDSHVETRHPLFDLRIQRFFLRLPVLPWCADKEILRSSMRGRLPEVILRRPKCLVQGNPARAILGELPPESLRDFRAAPQLQRYVLQRRIPDIDEGTERKDLEIDLRPVNLNYWLCQNLNYVHDDRVTFSINGD